MNTLVTGGAGFIGSQVAEVLLRRGHRVVVLDDLSGGFLDNVPAGAEFVQGSIADAALVAGARAHGARRGKTFEEIEVTRNLPEIWTR